MVLQRLDMLTEGKKRHDKLKPGAIIITRYCQVQE